MTKFKIFKDKKGEYRLTCIASNGRIIFTTEGYKRKISAENAFHIVVDSVYESSEENTYIV